MKTRLRLEEVFESYEEFEARCGTLIQYFDQKPNESCIRVHLTKREPVMVSDEFMPDCIKYYEIKITNPFNKYMNYYKPSSPFNYVKWEYLNELMRLED